MLDPSNGNSIVGVESLVDNSWMIAILIPVLCSLVLVLALGMVVYIKLSKSKVLKGQLSDIESFSDGPESLRELEKSTKLVEASTSNGSTATMIKSQSDTIPNELLSGLPITLLQGIPERIYFFSYNDGIRHAVEMIQYLMYPTNESVKARREFEPNSSLEIKVSIGDILHIKESRQDGVLFGFNLNTDEEGVFPLACATPRYNTQVILCDISDESGQVPIDREIINVAAKSFPTYLMIHKLTKIPDPFILMNLFNGPSGQHEECFISGPRSFASQMERKLNTLKQTGFYIPESTRIFQTLS